MSVDDAVSIADLAVLARRRLPRVIADYLLGGAEDEVTLARNRSAFERLEFRPRILPGFDGTDLSTTLFGHTYAVPFLIGPTGLNGLFWRGADVALARSAAALGAGMVAATPANDTLETIALATDHPKWFQLYPWGDRTLTGRLIARARAAGYKALVVTVDSLVPGKRERDLRHRFAHEVRMTPRVVLDGLLHPGWLFSTWLPRGMPRLENVAEFAPADADGHALAAFARSHRNAALSWDDLAWIAQTWPGPMLIKGVLTPEDAVRARDVGARGVVVSNHGGRQLDGAPATIDVLPAIVDAVGAELTVLVDGGVRRGSDIVKALALGAKAVLLGRATLFGVAAGGERGATRALAILEDEVRRVMALLGCPAVSALSREWIDYSGDARVAVPRDASVAIPDASVASRARQRDSISGFLQ